MAGQNPTNDHWRRLASELGLEIEPAPPEPVAPPPPPVESPQNDQFVAANDLPIDFAPDETETATIWDDEPPPPPPSEPAASEPAAEDDEPRRRRRRGRRKKSDVKREAAPAADSDSDDAADDATAEIVKDWDIPSWNDLIGSLYRPER